MVGAAERLGRPVDAEAPDLHGLLEHARAVELLLHDVLDRVVAELHRRVVPERERHAELRANARRLGLADGAHAPRAVARAPEAVGRDRELLARDLERARPEAGLRQARGVERDAAELADEVARLEVRRDVAVPDQIERESPLVRLADHAQLAQALDHLDAQRADARVHAVVAELARRAHHALYTVAQHHRERVGRAQVRVLAEAHDQEQLVAAAVQVEVVAVVEVAIAGRDVADRLGDLVDGVVVEGGEHARSLRDALEAREHDADVDLAALREAGRAVVAAQVLVRRHAVESKHDAGRARVRWRRPSRAVPNPDPCPRARARRTAGARRARHPRRRPRSRGRSPRAAASRPAPAPRAARTPRRARCRSRPHVAVARRAATARCRAPSARPPLRPGVRRPSRRPPGARARDSLRSRRRAGGSSAAERRGPARCAGRGA